MRGPPHPAFDEEENGMPSISMLQAMDHRESGGQADALPRGGLTRRRFLYAMAASAAVVWVPRSVGAAGASAFGDAAQTSTLVYVSPLLADGAESRCHGEVWFVADGDDLLVVTASDRWRAVAITRGRSRARLWVGEHGVWTRANEAWKKSPTRVASAKLDTDPKAHAHALDLFGKKYSAEWGKWGPRFQQGLASGDRVLIRYTPDPE
jgi:hypothetical protein